MDNTKKKMTLEQWRKIRCMSRAELARRTGITERTISNYESDINYLRKSSYDRLEKLASALKVSVNDIFLDPRSEKPKYTSKI